MSDQKAKTRNAYCSFCRKSYKDVGPLVEGPSDVYICGECIELCQEIIDQERVRRSPENPLGYYRAKVDRLVTVMEDAKLIQAHPTPPSSPAALPEENLDKILLLLGEIRRLVGGDTEAKPAS